MERLGALEWVVGLFQCWESLFRHYLSSALSLLRDTFNFNWVRNGLPVHKNGFLELGRFFPDLVQCICGETLEVREKEKLSCLVVCLKLDPLYSSGLPRTHRPG